MMPREKIAGMKPLERIFLSLKIRRWLGTTGQRCWQHVNYEEICLTKAHRNFDATNCFLAMMKEVMLI